MLKQAGKLAGVILIILAILLIENGEIGLLMMHAQTVVHIVHHVIPDIPHPITMHPIVHAVVTAQVEMQKYTLHIHHAMHERHLAHIKYLAYLARK